MSAAAASNLAIGVMTGNSLDAADAALLSFDSPATRLLATAREPILPALAARLRAIGESETIAIADLLQAQNEVSEVCARACAQLPQQAAGDAPIGCHGQTIAHRPQQGATWQLLNGALLAQKSGRNVVCDFRSQDIALGGEGAPLAPLFHLQFFAQHAPCDIINIGGIANITHIGAGGGAENCQAYDIGPGNMAMDAFCQQERGERYDANGNWATQGAVNEEWLATLLARPFFARPAPKSCGREEFALQKLLEGMPQMPAANTQATLLEFTARTIANSARAQQIYVCGGGGKNAALMRRLQQLKPQSQWQLTDAAGIPAEYMEAAAFAWLAHCHIKKIKINTAPITGGAPHIPGARYLA